MCFKNTKKRWGIVAQSLHWVIAVLFLWMWLLAEVMGNIQQSPENTFFGMQKYDLYAMHKSFGLLIMALVATRILWRVLNTPPSEGMKANKIEALAAKLGHLALYAVMVLMPVSGYTMSMAGGHGIKFFGWPVPNVFTVVFENGTHKALAGLAHEVHEITFEVFYWIIALHIAAALYHYYVKRDNVLQRMLPVRKA